MKQATNKQLAAKLAAPREMTPTERQLAMADPVLRERLLRYEAQDALLRGLPEPRLTSAAIGRVLTRTTLAQQVARRGGWRRRWAWSLLAIGAALVISLSGTGYAAAQSLPGDSLYQLKRGYERVRLSLIANPQRRAAYAEQLGLVRQAEARRMLQLGRQGVELELEGTLQRDQEGRWSVSGVPVELGENGWEPGMRVQMRGSVMDGRIQAREVHPHGGEPGAEAPGMGRHYGQTIAAATAEADATLEAGGKPGQGGPRQGPTQ